MKTIDVGIHFVIAPETAAMLAAFGWTPPQPLETDDTARYDPTVPTFARVKRHIEQLLAAEPALAEDIRALLPPAEPPSTPKTPRKTAAKSATDPQLSAIANAAASPATTTA